MKIWCTTYIVIVYCQVAPVSTKLPSVLSLTSAASTDTAESSPERGAAAGARFSVREEVSLGWQQKVFSRQEFRHYANAREEDFDTPMNKKLVCDAKKLMAEGFVPKNR